MAKKKDKIAKVFIALSLWIVGIAIALVFGMALWNGFVPIIPLLLQQIAGGVIIVCTIIGAFVDIVRRIGL